MELEREHSHREPVSLRRKLKRQSTSTIDKSLPAEGRDKPVPTRNPSFSPQRSVSPRRSTSPQRSPPPRKDESPPPSAPRRSRKSSSSDKPRSSKKSSSSEKILKLMENLVKPLADGFESMRAQQKKTQEQVEALAREDDEDPSSPLTEQPRPAHFRRLTTKKLERVNRRLDEVDSKVHRATSSAPELTKALADTRRSPLTRRLRQIELHERVRLKIDSYTGEEDPKKWLTAFNLAMRREKYKSYDEREANYCQVFVEHMAKDALTWFSNLPAESIDNFDDLTNAFLKHYSMHMTRITRNMFTTTQTRRRRDPTLIYRNIKHGGKRSPCPRRSRRAAASLLCQQNPQ
ncbi:unnamed protein product [Microthlaspi erraticum]|uniref:Retrotransposon gag domain-containing protein n=1 Tax=Microthlaspi erraticum TaxID=1685480 RepID=A0A6D2HVN3_9BRAS|nr:unnamed protein product [Microthlaspi erraticum]